MSSQPRCITPGDRERVARTAREWASTGSFTALRTRALVLLAWGSALRLKECCALNVVQLLEQDTSARWRLSSRAYLQPAQAKGRRKGPRQWTSAGSFVVTKDAREALRAYIRAARARGWMEWPPKPSTPLFIINKGREAGKHTRVGRRAVQTCWIQLQRRALIVNTYRFHDLRHDSITRFAAACKGDAFQVAAFGRFDVHTALRYVHLKPAQIAEMAELAARRRAARAAGAYV